MDLSEHQVTVGENFVEITTGDNTVQKEATGNFLEVPILSNGDASTIPSSVMAGIYAGAHSAEANQIPNRIKFTACDQSRGHPSALICDPKDLAYDLPHGHANITGQVNSETQDRYQPGASAHKPSVLLNGPHVAMEGLARRHEDGTEKTSDEIETAAVGALERVGYDVGRVIVSRDTFRPYCTVLVWLQGDATIAQALILYLSDRSVPDLAIHTERGPVMGCVRIRLPCFHPRAWRVMLRGPYRAHEERMQGRSWHGSADSSGRG
jgi:hypothetical protein